MLSLTNDMTWILYRAAYGTATYLRETHPSTDAETIRAAVFRHLGDDGCEAMEHGIADALEGRRPVSPASFQPPCARAGFVGERALR